MVETWWLAAGGLAVDGVVGDPGALPHPVRAIGWWVGSVDARSHPEHLSPSVARGLGVALALSTVALAAGVTWAICTGLGRLWPPLGWLSSLWLISTTIAWKGLGDAGLRVYRDLASHGVIAARQSVGMIVGRDTEALSETDILRASVETMAENLVDGVVSPVFFAVLGGAPLAMAYRALNTLDSMVGYRNARYEYFGWASARLDDVFNYVPARLTAILLWIALAVLGMSPGRAWGTMRRDAHRHPSPNAGIPEAMLAGSLGIRLGGLNYYEGVPSRRAALGTATRALEPQDILRTHRVLGGVSLLILALLVMGGVMLR